MGLLIFENRRPWELRSERIFLEIDEEYKIVPQTSRYGNVDPIVLPRRRSAGLANDVRKVQISNLTGKNRSPLPPLPH